MKKRQQNSNRVNMMTIKNKLLGAGAGTSLLLCLILAVTLYFFQNLNQGFQKIVDTSGSGVKKSQSADATIGQVNQVLDELSDQMSTISSSIRNPATRSCACISSILRY